MNRLYGKEHIVLLAFLAISLGVNVHLGLRVRDLTPGSQLRSNLIGAQIPPFSAPSADGKTIAIDWQDSSKTVIYFFDPDCSWCKRNAPALSSLIEEMGSGYRFVAISGSASGTMDFARSTKLPVPVLINVPKEIITKMGLHGTPQTFVIDQQGRIEQHWLGAYSGANREEIVDFFRLKTPLAEVAAKGEL